jgi:hypothetical protein
MDIKAVSVLLVKSFSLAVKYDHVAISPLIIARLAASRVMLNLPSCVFMPEI